MTTDIYTPDNLIARPDIDILGKSGTLKSGQGILPRGAMLGAISRALGAVSAVVGTGNGTISGVAMKAATKLGVYLINCIAVGVPTAGAATGAAVAGNAGNGTITASPTVGVGAKIGIYNLTCIEPATDLGKFMLQDPDGHEVGTVTVGAQFVGGGLTFTVADGSNDFASGDSFTITVATVAANGGIFSVHDPDGIRLADAVVGVAYANSQIGFTLNDGTSDFIANDHFTITIGAGSGKFLLLDKTAVDGSADPVAADLVVLAATTDTTADAVAPLYQTGCFNKASVSFAAGTVAADYLLPLQSRNIYLADMQATFNVAT